MRRGTRKVERCAMLKQTDIKRKMQNNNDVIQGAHCDIVFTSLEDNVRSKVPCWIMIDK